MKNKCIWVLNIGNYLPEITNKTLPTIERYAKRVDADLKVISTTQYNRDLTFEKMQVYNSTYEYNALIDLDIAINDSLPNCFERSDEKVRCFQKHNGFRYYEQIPIFQNAEIIQVGGVDIMPFPSASFIVTNSKNHSIWEPNLQISEKEMLSIVVIPRMIDELNIALNMCKTSLRCEYVFNKTEINNMIHLAATSVDLKNHLKELDDFILKSKICKLL